MVGFIQLIDTRNIDMKSTLRLIEPVVDAGKIDRQPPLRVLELGDALRETKNSSNPTPDNLFQPNTHL
jgi:hypothetical protein